MERVTIRVPAPVIRAYDSADGNRSALMRRHLSEPVENGELENVPDDLLALARREAAVEKGELVRKAARFKSRAYDYYAEEWQNGAVTGADMDRLAESWREEADLYGPESRAFVDALTEWYVENYTTDADKPEEMPDPEYFVAVARDDEQTDAGEVARRAVERARDDGHDREEARRVLSRFHDDREIENAIREVYA